MVYLAKKGTIHTFWYKTVWGLGITAPLLALLFLGVAVFSSANYRASGHNPMLNLPARSSSKTAAPNQTSTSNSASASPASGTVAAVSSPPAALNSGTSMSSSTSLLNNGGLGAGPIGASSATSAPAPLTVTIPPLDVQAAGKQIISTDGSSLTVN